MLDKLESVLFITKELLSKKAPNDFSSSDKEKHERCVLDLKDKGKDVGSAHAICTSAMEKDEISKKPNPRIPTIMYYHKNKVIKTSKPTHMLAGDSELLAAGYRQTKVVDNVHHYEHHLDRDKTATLINHKQVEIKKEENMQKDEPLYHLHEGGQQITDKPKTMRDIIQDHGSVKRLENSGIRIVRHSEVKKSEDMQEVLKTHANGQWELVEKAAKKSTEFSMFKPEHLHEVLAKPHNDAKQHAHSIVDSSPATPANKTKAKTMIDSSKNSKHLAMGMSNFMLGAGGLHVDAGGK